MAEYEAGDWLVDYGQANCRVFQPLTGETPEAEAARLQLMTDCENVAVNMLWNFTNRIFGSREVFVRPIRKGPQASRPTTFEGRGPLVNYPVGRSLGWMPVMIDGAWYNLRCGSCAGHCSCEQPWSIKLPQAQAVLGVQIGDTLIPSSDYWLSESCLIHKTASWPTRQDVRQEIGAPNTWGVWYLRGVPVPRAGELAAGVLACELGKAAKNDASCQLPSRVQTVTRQGVTLAILDTFDDLAKGRTGIPAVDMWVQSVNLPRSASRLPASPDFHQH